MELDPTQHSPETVAAPPAPARLSFAEELANLARGTLNDEATMALADLVEAVTDLGKKGTLTIEVTVEPAGSGGRTVTIAGKVAVKAPKPDPELSIRFVGPAGTLHRDDPFVRPLPGIPYRDAEGTPRVVDQSGEVRRLDESAMGAMPRPVDPPAPPAPTQEDTQP